MTTNQIDNEHLQAIIEAEYRLFAQKLARLSAMIVVIYDTLLTIDREVEFFWKQRWTLIKILYMINRYGGIFILAVDTWGSVTEYRNLPFCQFQFYFQQWTGWIAVLLVEIILIIRVNTLYERSRKSTILLSTLFFVQAALMATVLIKWDLMFTLRYLEDINACGSKDIPPVWISFFWLPPIVMDLFLLILTLRKSLTLRGALSGKSWSDSRLHKMLVRDQALYFIGILICSLANMGFFAIYPKILCAALGFALGFPCVMGSRILLNLKEIAREEMRCGLSTSRVFTSIQFAEMPARREGTEESIEMGYLSRTESDEDRKTEVD